MAYSSVGNGDRILCSLETPDVLRAGDFWMRTPSDETSPWDSAPLLSPPPFVHTVEPLRDEDAFTTASPAGTIPPEQRPTTELDLLEEILFKDDSEGGVAPCSGVWTYDPSAPCSGCCHECILTDGKVPPVGSGLKYLRPNKRPPKAKKKITKKKKKEQHQRVSSRQRTNKRLGGGTPPKKKRHCRDLGHMDW